MLALSASRRGASGGLSLGAHQERVSCPAAPQAWRVVHQPKRGSYWNRPKVHSGFHKAWRNNNLNTRVIMRIKELIKAGEVDPVKLQFTVTGLPLPLEPVTIAGRAGASKCPRPGWAAACLASLRQLMHKRSRQPRMLLNLAGHSLGGALATLAAYDVRAVGKKYGNDCKVSCYTCAPLSSSPPSGDPGAHTNALHFFRPGSSQAERWSASAADGTPAVRRFGAPRTGNHAFAEDFQQMVPNCWYDSQPPCAACLHARLTPSPSG